jgi:hypothetical protein
MKRRLHLIAGVMFVLVLAYDLYAWGGLARHAELGPLLHKASSNEVSLAGVYMQAGAPLLDLAGLREPAGQAAAETFASALSRVRNNPAAAMDTLQRDMSFGVQAAYYGAPLLLVLFGLLLWLRPREVHMVGRR